MNKFLVPCHTIYHSFWANLLARSFRTFWHVEAISQGTACIDGPRKHILCQWTFHCPLKCGIFQDSGLIHFLAWVLRDKLLFVTQRNTSWVLTHPTHHYPSHRTFLENQLHPCEFHHISGTTKFLKCQVVVSRIRSEWECKKANGITICKISHVLVQSHLGTTPLTKPHWEGFRFYSQRRQEWTHLTPRSGPPRDIIGKWLQKSCRNWSSRHLSP